MADSGITITFTRAHLVIGIALAVAFGAGISVGKFLLDSSSTPQAAPASATTEGSATQSPALVNVDITGRPFLGPEDAEVTIAEFTDYQCPFCARHFRETMPQLLDQYEGKIKYVVFNFPIASIHPDATKAAEAAECAHAQGKFWEYHDLLFENQQALGIANLKSYALDAGLETSSFEACLDSGSQEEQVLKDFRAGRSYGVNGTPTFFLNGRAVVGFQPFSGFAALVQAALDS